MNSGSIKKNSSQYGFFSSIVVRWNLKHIGGIRHSSFILLQLVGMSIACTALIQTALFSYLRFMLYRYKKRNVDTRRYVHGKGCDEKDRRISCVGEPSCFVSQEGTTAGNLQKALCILQK